MFVYIMLAVVIGLSACQETGSRSIRDNQLFHICLFLIFLVTGLRYMHGDYATYEIRFNEMLNAGGDWGFYQLQLFAKKIGMSFQLFIFLMAIPGLYAL